jgi:DNA-binding protein HU-beta
MNKSDLISYVSDKTKITEKDSGIIIDVFINGMIKGLNNGDRVKLKGFGSFYLQDRKSRTAFNPRNQETIDVPAKTIIKFKPSKKLFDIINKK